MKNRHDLSLAIVALAALGSLGSQVKPHKRPEEQDFDPKYFAVEPINNTPAPPIKPHKPKRRKSR